MEHLRLDAALVELPVRLLRVPDPVLACGVCDMESQRDRKVLLLLVGVGES